MAQFAPEPAGLVPQRPVDCRPRSFGTRTQIHPPPGPAARRLPAVPRHVSWFERYPIPLRKSPCRNSTTLLRWNIVPRGSDSLSDAGEWNWLPEGGSRLLAPFQLNEANVRNSVSACLLDATLH